MTDRSLWIDDSAAACQRLRRLELDPGRKVYVHMTAFTSISVVARG